MASSYTEDRELESRARFWTAATTLVKVVTYALRHKYRVPDAVN